jgi:uncharacterized iron-regulated protein
MKIHETKKTAMGIVLVMAVLLTIASNCRGSKTNDECGDMIVDVLLGEPVTREYFIEDLASVGVVFLGEFHTIDRHHRVQKEIIEALHEKGRKPAVGMEMFSLDQQDALDRWMSGNMDIAHLKYLLGNFWTNLDDYKDTLLMIRERGIPLLALNAQDSLVKSVARNGLEGLSKEQARRIPEGTANINPKNSRLLSMKLKVHKAFQHMGLDRIIQAQALRDQTMAKTIARFVESKEGRDGIMVVIAGSGHLNYGLGLPERTEKLVNAQTRIVLPSESGELVLSEKEREQSVPVKITHSDLKFINQPIGDYLILSPLKDYPAPGDDDDEEDDAMPAPGLATLLKRSSP